MIGVAGPRTMGRGIALLAATLGQNVLVWGRSEASVADLRAHMLRWTARRIGHPIGASGARLLVTLFHEMKRRNIEFGVASLCVGGGLGIAALIRLAP